MELDAMFDMETNSSSSNPLLVQSPFPMYMSDIDTINILANDPMRFRPLPQSGYCQHSFWLGVSRPKAYIT